MKYLAKTVDSKGPLKNKNGTNANRGCKAFSIQLRKFRILIRIESPVRINSILAWHTHGDH